MTAVVGILNKDAVALAADSAVTISGNGGRKIMNGANKLFRLSKYHPVGIMIYNSASFMGTPWETIIKLYRRQLTNTAYNSLDNYVTDFIDFLRSRHFFTNPATIQYYVEDQLANGIWAIVPESVQQELDSFSVLSEERKAEIVEQIKSSALQFQSTWEKTKKVPEFESFTREKYDLELKNVASDILDSWAGQIGLIIDNDFKEQVHIALHLYICSENANSNYTGLIFSGFGELDLYPKLIPVNISFCYDDRLHYFIDVKRKAEINYTHIGEIRPFAQQDVMDTILTGVDPDLERVFIKNLWRFFDKFKDEVLEALGDGQEEISAKIRAIETKTVVEEMVKQNRHIKRQKYLSPLFSAVASLSKPDLAELAESLIYLTYLKRRITFAEESVGGPVDVAIISKGDGFIWIKRKHYFDPKLNQHFFDNYYNP